MKVFDFNIPDCKRFTGYKPCFPYKTCYEGCTQNDRSFGKKILIINLDAMGDVLMTTAQLEPIKRKYPESYIGWVTLKSAAPLLQENPLIDDVFVWDAESWLILEQMAFDLILNVDKSTRSAALTMKLRGKEKLGFGLNENAQIVPLNKEASYNYKLGIDDYLKFRVNQRTGQDILAETFKLPYQRDEYVLRLTEEEIALTSWYRKSKGIGDKEVVIGFNTGCSNLYPNKKMTIGQHLKLIEKFSHQKNIKMLLLGGREDFERNEQIYSTAIERNPELMTRLFNTPTTEGIRKGIIYENAADIVITGDSFGMHLAIALKKYVLVWFGVSCWTEIDLYDRGTKFIPEGLFCSPCWKKSCPYNLECIQMIDIDKMYSTAVEYTETIRTDKVKLGGVWSGKNVR
ncbi:MAG: lipopolysaccharide heptosyltransferase family protein [Bacteroidetes bacterium]|nr:lipopolysaccharide heptosyltransferase family protein [Bacteroidota bacterium]MCL5737029.1 lipopolysaccharide heptosyltransferase family protein [Bacteroidota bacterium]